MSSLLVFVAACALAAFCSGSETAFSAAGKVQVAASGKRGARALWFMEKPSRYLATTLVGTNIGVVLTSSISHRWGSQMGGVWEAVFIFVTALFLLLFLDLIFENHHSTTLLSYGYYLVSLFVIFSHMN